MVPSAPSMIEAGFEGDLMAQGSSRRFNWARVPNVVRSGQADHEVAEGPVGTVHCEQSLGGLLKSYRRAA